MKGVNSRKCLGEREGLHLRFWSQSGDWHLGFIDKKCAVAWTSVTRSCVVAWASLRRSSVWLLAWASLTRS